MTRNSRELLGKSTTGSIGGSLQRVYLRDDGLDVENVSGYEVTVKRVYFDDVLLVTRHQRVGTGFIVFTGFFSALFGILVGAYSLGGADGVAVFFAVVTLCFFLPLVLRVVLKLDVVTVFGARSRASMQFWFRKDRASEVFERVCHVVRETQDRIAEEIVRQPT